MSDRTTVLEYIQRSVDILFSRTENGDEMTWLDISWVYSSVHVFFNRTDSNVYVSACASVVSSAQVCTATLLTG